MATAAGSEKVTVDKSYFDALLRRADFHVSAQHWRHQDPANATISRIEYDSLLRASREYELLKQALFQGGITTETLDLLISGGANGERKDSGSVPHAWADDYEDGQQTPYVHGGHNGNSWRQKSGSMPYFNRAPGSGNSYHAYGHHVSGSLNVPPFSRQVSLGAVPSSVPDETGLDDNESLGDEATYNDTYPPQEKRTLYFAGLSDRTTYRDLLSIIKGGKLLSVNMRNERSATVTLHEGAAEFLAWAKRSDIYLNSKRIEVKWAEHQYRLNRHINNKILNGATRNLLIQGASGRGLTGAQITADMEHIHNLHIIDVVFRNGDALVSTNSVHNALFARTCMMSRTTYKGCKISFVRDECDVPLPVPSYKIPPSVQPAKKKAALANRFDMLNLDGSDRSSNEENKTPVDDVSETGGTDAAYNMGVSLGFLDTESVA